MKLRTHIRVDKSILSTSGIIKYRRYILIPSDTPVLISKGYAVFDATMDKNYRNTFERADHAKYEDKKAYYSKNNIDRRKV